LFWNLILTLRLLRVFTISFLFFFQNYIAPRIFGTRSRLEQNYEKLLESMTKLNENVVELKELIKEMQLQPHASSRSQSSFELQDMKKEISAIKSLLLGRSQFPSPSSGIPSWQMVEAGEGDNSNENSDESSSRRRPKKDKSERRKEPEDSQSEKGDEEVLTGTMRKHPSLDSNISNSGFCSGSSCEVVFVGKNDSSDPDHSDE